MKNEKISRRSFLKASAVASALGVMAAAPAAHAAGADKTIGCHIKSPFMYFLIMFWVLRTLRYQRQSCGQLRKYGK